MKIMKTRKDLFFIAGSGFILAGLVFFLVLTPLIPKLFYGHWAFLFLALILGISPSSKKTYGETRLYSPARWLALIFLMQISLLAMHLGILSASHAKELLEDGLFPWGWVAILASAFASVAYFGQENAFGSSLLSPLIKTRVEKPTGIIINNIVKFAQSLALVITFALMILLIAQMLGFHPSAPFSEPLPLLGLLLLILFSFTKSYKRLLARVCAYPAWLLISAFILLLGCIIAGLHAISKPLQFTLPLPSFLNDLQNYPPHSLSSITSLGWWLGFSFLASLFLARISRGYSRRTLISATLILPAFLAIFSILFPSLSAANIPNLLRHIVGISGFLISMILFTNKKMLSPFVLNYLPKNGESKYRNPEFLLRKLFQLSLIFLYIYLPLGPILSAAFISISLFPMLIFTLSLGLCQCASGSVLASGYKSGK